MLHRGVFAERHFTVLERFPGTDLGNVVADLTTAERRAIASAVVGLQNRMRELPDGAGYGHVTNYNGPYPKSSWAAFIDLMVTRSAARCAEGGIVDPRCITRVRRHTEGLVSYFASIEPRPFLDDLTTKNVIVSQNRLVGVVDVDEVCFGDRLLHVGLTRMAFLDQGWDEDYIAELCHYEGFGVAEHHALVFYTALYCVDFLAELGHAFNREGPPAASAEALERRMLILEALLSDLAHISGGG
jgi:aminoglycoside phosphotransferase (APT) family kinase protein